MSTLLIVTVTAIVAAIVLAYAGYYLTQVIKDDGGRMARRTPPRSHHADLFDPRSRLA
ncbi:MAG: hypothetical protein HOQ45_02590 [Nocardioidaceae bacterium]|nr:hypothetical protein [Nocardioidaceae bacterium]